MSDAGAGAPVRRRRLCRPRLGPRLRCAQGAGLCALRRARRSTCRCVSEGDVDARVWIRIDEVEQSPGADRADPRAAAGGRRRARSCAGLRASAAEGMALVEGFRGDILAWVRLGAGRRDRALPSARSVLVPVAAAGGGDRRQHRRRLPALQQIVQLLLLGPRPVEATPMRKLLLESLLQAAAHRAAAGARRRRARRAGAEPRARVAPPARPQPVDPRGRRRLLQRLRARDPRAQQRLLRPGALRPALRRLAAPRRRAAGHRAR